MMLSTQPSTQYPVPTLPSTSAGLVPRGNLYIAYAICYRSIAEEEGGGAVAPVHLLR